MMAAAAANPPVKASVKIPVKLILNMIVKNESKIIRRCLEAACPLLDAVVISDTGSTDDTVDIIRDTCRERGIRCRVLTDEPWKNFGHNRTVALNAARKFADYDPLTYILMLDADMVLKVSPETFDPEMLLAYDKWNVEQRAGGMSYWNPRIVRASVGYRSVGVTHEYLDQPPGTTETRMSPELLYIDDRNDGGSKSDKSERDIKLLEDGLIAEPQNMRYMFYLANTYREIGKFAKAIHWYARHRELSNWAEERWYAAFYTAMSYAGLNKLAETVDWCLTAYAERPERAEPLYYLANYYRVRGEPRRGYVFALAAAGIEFPKEELLFINRSIYDYENLYELSICGFYAGEPGKIQARAASNRLLLDNRVPHYIHDSVMWNLRFMVPTLDQLVGGGKTPQWKSLQFEALDRAKWHACNPSIAIQGPGGDVALADINIRGVSYTQRQARNYAGDMPFRTLNEWDSHDHRQVLLPEFHGPFQETCSVRGLEDVRLFYFQDSLWGSATCLEMIPSNLPQIVLMRLSAASPRDTETSLPSAPVLLRVVKEENSAEVPAPRTEKNWLLFESRGEDTGGIPELLCLYGYQDNQITILKVDPVSGNCRVHSVVAPPNPYLRTSHWKGSAGPMRILEHGSQFWDDWLLLVHFTIDRPEERRYYHQFVVLNCDDFRIKAISPAFVFRNDTDVEMCLSMVMTTTGYKVNLAYGYGDREAHIVSVPLEGILNACVPVEQMFA